MKGQNSKFHLLLAALGLIIFAFFTYITRHGLVVGFDSYHYLRSAEGLRAGQGFGWVNPDGSFEGMSHFPPVYPALIALVSSLTNLPAVQAARWVAVLAGTVFSLLTGIYLWRVTRSRWMALLALFLTTLFNPMLTVMTAAMSESLFFALFAGFLLSFDNLLHSRSKKDAAIAGILTAAMMLTRYAAAAVFLTALLSLLMANRRTLRSWLKPGLGYILTAVLPVGIWLIVARQVTGSSTSRSLGVHLPDASRYAQAWEAIQSWFITPIARYRLHDVASVFLLLIVLLSVWLFITGRKQGPSSPTTHTATLSLGTYLIVYPLVLWFSAAFVDASTRWNDRILSPWLFALTLVWIIRGYTAWKDCRQPLLKHAFPIALVLLCLVNGYGGVKYARQLAAVGDGLTTQSIRKMALLDQVRSLPPDTVIYTNNVPIIYFDTGRNALSIPIKMDTIRNVPADDYQPNLEEMLAKIHNGKAVLVIFRPYSDKDGVYPDITELKSELTQTYRTEDGFILK